MHYELTFHIQQRIQLRDIPPELVINAIENPEQVTTEDGLTVHYLRCTQNGKPYLLWVFLNTDVDPAKAVTAYLTSKISKYWR